MPNDNEALSAAGSTVLFREWCVSPNILKMSNNKMNAVTLKPQSSKSDDSSLSYYCLFCKFAHDDCWDFLVGRKPQLDQSLSCYLCFSRTTRTCFNSPDSPLWQDAHWLISTETLAHTDGIFLAHGHGCQVESLFPTSQLWFLTSGWFNLRSLISSPSLPGSVHCNFFIGSLFVVTLCGCFYYNHWLGFGKLCGHVNYFTIGKPGILNGEGNFVQKIPGRWTHRRAAMAELTHWPDSWLTWLSLRECPSVR